MQVSKVCLPTVNPSHGRPTLVWKGMMLHRSGRVVLIETTLTAMLIHVAISVELPPWALKAMRKIMTVFLWSGTDEVQGRICLVGWNQVERPLHLGGVRIDGPREGELSFLFYFKTLMRNLNKVNLHNSRSPNSPNAS
jgi:hypothetical protein